jgi:hypothetical protein
VLQAFFGADRVFVDWEVDILYVQFCDSTPSFHCKLMRLTDKIAGVTFFDRKTQENVQQIVLSPEKTTTDDNWMKINYQLELDISQPYTLST